MKDNTTLMREAITRWITECEQRPDGAAVLAKRVVWMNEMIALCGRNRTPLSFKGITVWDMMAERGRLEDAATRLAQ